MSPLAKYRWAARHKRPYYKVVGCKFCGSKNIIKYGHFKSSQRYWCKDCRRKFASYFTVNDLPIMNMFYNNGLSLHAISEKINRRYNYYLSEGTIFRWIYKYSRLGYEEVKSFRPRVGDSWIINENGIRLLGRNYYLLDVIDSDTLFLLSTRLLTIHMNIKSIIQPAVNRVGKIPLNITLLANSDFFDTSASAHHFNIEDIKITLADKKSVSEIKYKYLYSFNTRNKLISNLKKKENVKKILDGWNFHYNFRKIHESLNGKSPAEKAGLVGV